VTSVLGDPNVENQVTVPPAGTSDRVRSGSRQIKEETHMASKKIAVSGIYGK
jgi:flagellar hook-length control protein FliK